MSNQISPEALKSLLDQNAARVLDTSHTPVKVVDGSWALDSTDMHALFLTDHIPGAQFFDLEAISNHATNLPHMAPSPEAFAAAVGRMGISAEDHVVVYDRQGLFSAARVWWTFKLMGHGKVQVLHGGLPAWKAAGFPVSDEVATPVATVYAPRFQNQKVIDLKSLKSILKVQDYLILDARPQARFEGTAPEPRPGLRSGHMPGSRSLPFAELLRDGALKPNDELRSIFAGRGLNDLSHVVTSCGSGVTAAILSMALDELGHAQAVLYDGSWAEWGQVGLDTPVVTGIA